MLPHTEYRMMCVPHIELMVPMKYNAILPLKLLQRLENTAACHLFSLNYSSFWAKCFSFLSFFFLFSHARLFGVITVDVASLRHNNNVLVVVAVAAIALYLCKCKLCVCWVFYVVGCKNKTTISSNRYLVLSIAKWNENAFMPFDEAIDESSIYFTSKSIESLHSRRYTNTYAHGHTL